MRSAVNAGAFLKVCTRSRSPLSVPGNILRTSRWVEIKELVGMEFNNPDEAMAERMNWNLVRFDHGSSKKCSLVVSVLDSYDLLSLRQCRQKRQMCWWRHLEAKKPRYRLIITLCSKCGEFGVHFPVFATTINQSVLHPGCTVHDFSPIKVYLTSNQFYYSRNQI